MTETDESVMIPMKYYKNMKKILGVLVAPLLLTSFVNEDTSSKIDTTIDIVEEVKDKPIEEPVEEPKQKKWVCDGCTENERIVLEFLQDRGINDKVALSVIMGNIKQESMFNSNICEGGARVPYHHCHSGGYGLIQWTTSDRYHGLGHFTKKYGGDPTHIESQLRYMVNERQWTDVEHVFKTPGLSVSRYMNSAYYWLGWGIHGNRTHYSNQYINRLVQV